jgi:penicillin-binding protein 2
MIFRRNKKNSIISKNFDPDEVFLDSTNMPGFDTHHMEGRIEKPISRMSILFIGGFFMMVGLIFTGRVWWFQVVEGQAYAETSERNHLRHIPIFSVRGVIYDRNKVELAWNTVNEKDPFPIRSYSSASGLAHLIGYVSHPKIDSSGNFWQTEVTGQDGAEKKFDDVLRGENGVRLVESDVMGKLKSEISQRLPVDGGNVTLSIDSRVESKLYDSMKALAGQVGFTGGAGVIIDVNNGEILALTSYPEYSSQVLSNGDESNIINTLLRDKNKPFLNRATAGLYTPGSTVKPFLAAGALEGGIIDPLKQIYSSGSISIPNPYFPDKPSVFKDWRANGWTDVRHAIAVSSDVYFYAIGGGYEGQKGLGISEIGRVMRMFGFGEKTGIDFATEVAGTIPSPEWKEKSFGGAKWLLGDTYHTSIGQYGTQVSPLQLARATAAVANGGTLYTPHITLGQQNLKTETIPVSAENFQIIREGMRLAVLEGTAKGLQINGLAIGAKTGTAELGAQKQFVNAWIMGFFPYEKPRYAFVVVMERGPHENTIGGLFVMRQVLEWMQVKTPEYLK